MKDVLGRALLAHFQNPHNRQKLWVLYADGSKDEMTVATYFRPFRKMPLVEQIALQECHDTILDIGAGAGSHSLYLQEKGFDVTALDYSPGAATVARERGIKKVLCEDVFSLKNQKFDTLLLLMNGIGLVGDMAGLRRFLLHAETLLKDGGQILFDSSDVAYLYNSYSPLPDHYYGEIACRYSYGSQKTDWFTWLYIDRKTLEQIALQTGWQAQLLFEDEEEDHYLMRLKKANGLK